MFDPKKIDKLFSLMRKAGLDAVIVGPSNNLEYMTGFNPGGCERFQGLFLTPKKEYFYICNLIYAEDMKRWFEDAARFYVWNDSQGWHDTLKTAMADFGLEKGRIAVAESIRAVDLLDMMTFLSCEFINGVELLEELRIIKTGQELKDLKIAAKMADEVMDELTRFVRPGMTEKQVKIKILDLFKEKGAQGISFDPIVACGNNSSRPHYCQDSGVIQKKDVLLLDFGCRYNGLCSDISRTFFIGGISAEEEKIYKVARTAQENGIKAAKEKEPCCRVDQAARDYIASQGFKDNFLNRTGHGIGFDVHEAPYMNARNTRPLERGMAFSVEPGICIPGKVGMRVEDIVVIDHDGKTQVLNQFTKEIVIIK